MSSELWAIIGVVVGAVAGGGAQILQATLQRRWAKHDAGMAWERERLDRLFDYKRDAHTAFYSQFRYTLERIDDLVLEKSEAPEAKDLIREAAGQPTSWLADVLAAHPNIFSGLHGEVVEDLDRLRERRDAIGLYGSPEAHDAAMTAYGALNRYAFALSGSLPLPDPRYAETAAAETAFRNAVRRDLGVESGRKVLNE